MMRVRKAWNVSAKGYDEIWTAYGPTAGRVRADAWRSINDSGDFRIVDVTVRRNQPADVILPDPDPIADQLSKEERHCLLHAFGGNTTDPVKWGNRDYFYTRRDDPPLVRLAELGLMKPTAGDKWGEDMTYFLLTEQGKHVCLSLTPEYRK